MTNFQLHSIKKLTPSLTKSKNQAKMIIGIIMLG